MSFTTDPELLAAIEMAQASHKELIAKLGDMGFTVRGEPPSFNLEVVKTFLERPGPGGSKPS